MRCEDVRALAGVWLDHELSGPRAQALAAHEAGCAECQAYIADLRHLTGQMALLGREPAPEGLEARIRGLLAEEAEQDISPPPRAAPPWRHRWLAQAASLAAVCLLSVSGTWAVMHLRAEGTMAGHDVVAAHMRALLQDSPIQVASSDQHTVRPWFNGRVEFAPPVKDLTAEGFSLAGGRLDFVEGRRVATLVYRRRLHTISVFVWPEAPGTATAWRPAQVSGVNLLSWNKGGMVWWAVSDLNPEELRELRTLL